MRLPRLRFRLYTLMVLVTIVALAMALTMVIVSRRQRCIVLVGQASSEVLAVHEDLRMKLA
jgi:hypothetical protein